MRIVIQRVLEAKVTIDGVVKGEIGRGYMILVGIEEADNSQDIEWLAGKIARIRLFDDENGVMNLPITAIGGEILLVSQFTLQALVAKGNRPSYIRAARPEISVPIYEEFIDALERAIGKPIQTGVFGADMKVSLVNDGPVTILIDSKRRE